MCLLMGLGQSGLVVLGVAVEVAAGRMIFLHT